MSFRAFTVQISVEGFSVIYTVISQAKGITTFNDQEIKRGHTIGPELVQAIRESRVSIVVLSKKEGNFRSAFEKTCQGKTEEVKLRLPGNTLLIGLMKQK
ncbi:unnamed protein product [Arabidopsis lyrata]|uniref:disease resistance protein RML1B-like n=1 Tax=Arabidopsis lyrata subsp. lyrata TaxID=81972 RepID=UPI000A29B209|nr:disease resistance protein RML1B-like [Arabidopsis lyrata subsp. lyrata]CAH8277825.1 unnamed protein product [Arabidopsis lyrata]|eukprot:XP_020872266.1 disease resistance protein RML1B-like [Arabidopsis lyrata subsp. lyrata]